MERVTAGQDYLGEVAPQFAQLNDDVLFGQVWSREGHLAARDRSLITITALLGAGILDQSLESHFELGRQNGISKAELVEVITHLAFYTGWPKAWAAFTLLEKVYAENDRSVPDDYETYEDPEHFSKTVYLKTIQPFRDLSYISDVVLFPPATYNNWHVHQVEQTLYITQGSGWYQEEGKAARALKAGDIVHVPAGVKHWHGAAKDSWFEHIATEDVSKGAPDWYDRLPESEYQKL